MRLGSKRFTTHSLKSLNTVIGISINQLVGRHGVSEHTEATDLAVRPRLR